MKASAISSTTARQSPAHTSQPERFALTGTSWIYDPRVHAARRDVADIALAGRLFAPHYARPLTMVCTVAHLPLFDRPGPAGRQTSELLLGEHFEAIDMGGGWAWGYSAHDHYVGYVSADGLTTSDDKAVRMPGAGNHADPAALAQSLVGTPFLAGGRSGAGIDAAGLIQTALAPFEICAPRDTDLQRAALGAPLPAHATAVRNDLVFVAGHVGILADAGTLIHASGSVGAVVAEPLADVVARLGDEDLLVRRVMP